jgi:hypothetical protein
MSEIPTKDAAREAMERAERVINFHSADLKMLEEWLGWRRYDIACSILAQTDDALRAKFYGMAQMCQELILMGTNARKLANPQEK